jgi:hypothetical protein
MFEIYRTNKKRENTFDSLFIFCVEKEKYEQLLTNANYSKLMNIFTNQQTLMRSTRQTIELIEQQSSVFTLYYRGNKKELENIQQFEKTYTSNNAIQWYTKDCFICRLINKALRTEDIEVLHTFWYFISGLSACLMKDYELMNRNMEIIRWY